MTPSAAKITIFAGHYGSGKTILAVNYALYLKNFYSNVTLCDLDIVNPYFRAADFIRTLKQNGINTLSSDYVNSNLDMPAVPSGMQAAFDSPGLHTVVDLGGDDRGALALGRYAKLLNGDKNYEMLLVINPFRPLTRGADDILKIKEEIESASGVWFTGIASNPNLGSETTAEDIKNSRSLTDSIMLKTGLPLAFTAVSDKIPAELLDGLDVFPINIMKKPDWKVN